MNAHLLTLRITAVWLQWWGEASEHAQNTAQNTAGLYLGVYSVFQVAAVAAIFAVCWLVTFDLRVYVLLV